MFQQLVAYFCFSRKWIRAEVDECQYFSGEKVLILWAIDYGLPLYTSNLEDVFPLPEACRFPTSKIFAASLSVMPATYRFDHVNCKLITEFSEEWNERAVKEFETSVANALEINFIVSTQISHDEIVIGEVLIGDQSIVHYGLSSKLVEKDLALVVPNKEFLNYYSRLRTNNIERWNDNRRSGGVMKGPQGVMIGITDMADKLEIFNQEDANSSSSSYIKSCSLKVENWLKQNEQIEQDNASEISSSNSVGTLLDLKSVEDNPVKHPTKTSKQLRDLLMKCSDEKAQDNEAEKSVHETSQETSRIIFLPAGAQMQTNIRNPSYQKMAKRGRRGSGSERKSINEHSTFDDEQFVSVSQVGAEITSQSENNL